MRRVVGLSFLIAGLIAGEAFAVAATGPYIPCNDKQLGESCTNYDSGSTGMCIESPGMDGCSQAAEPVHTCLMCAIEPWKPCDGMQAGDACLGEGHLCVERFAPICPDQASSCLHCEYDYELCANKAVGEPCGQIGICGGPEEQLECHWSSTRSCEGKQEGDLCVNRDGDLAEWSCQPKDYGSESYLTCLETQAPTPTPTPTPTDPPSSDSGGCSVGGQGGPAGMIMLLALWLFTRCSSCQGDEQ